MVKFNPENKEGPLFVTFYQKRDLLEPFASIQGAAGGEWEGLHFPAI